MGIRGLRKQGNGKLPLILVTLGLIAIAIAIVLAPTNTEAIIPTKLTIHNIRSSVYFGVAGGFLCFFGVFLYWALHRPRTRKIEIRE